jgi:hypothetical protein
MMRLRYSLWGRVAAVVIVVLVVVFYVVRRLSAG